MASELQSCLDLKKILGDHYDRPWNHPFLVDDRLSAEAIRQRASQIWQEQMGQPEDIPTDCSLSATLAK